MFLNCIFNENLDCFDIGSLRTIGVALKCQIQGYLLYYKIIHNGSNAFNIDENQKYNNENGREFLIIYPTDPALIPIAFIPDK